MRKSGLVINPPNENVELHVTKVGDARSSICARSDSQGVVNLNSLGDGNYDMKAYALGTVPLLLLHTFQMTVVNGAANVPVIDLKATTLHVTFKKSDKPLDQARIVGKFTDKQGRIHSLNGQTNSEGVATLLLPEGIIEQLVADKEKIEVRKVGNVTIPPPAPTPLNVPRPPKYVIIDVDSSSFTSSINPTEKNARIVILGDISGSMSSGTKMDILRRSFQEIFEKCEKNRWNVSLASWGTEIEWCTEKWIQPNQTETVKTWITRQQARGGNDMRTAIDDCMKRYPDATDVYVMCDGDITPFDAYQGEPNWGCYRC